MKRILLKSLILTIFACILAGNVSAQNWTEKVRGSWIRNDAAQLGDVVLVHQNTACEIVVGEKEQSNVTQAAARVEKINGNTAFITISLFSETTA